MTSQPEFKAETDKPIFISYSRKNRDFARALYEELTAIGFNTYRDLHDLEPGEDWWQQLKQAIEDSETMILCLSPDAIASPIVKREWHHARRTGTRLIPVVAADVDFNEVPRWMKRVDWLDYREGTPENNIQWARLIQTLNTLYFPRKVLHTAPPPPQNMVARPELFEPIIQSLVDDEDGAVALTAALQGAGGFGKTTLAQAICDDPDIQGAFDDGILWITLGASVTESEITTKILDIVYQLTGNRPDVQSFQAAGDMLKDALEDRYILLVIDDVWKPEHLAPFLYGGENCARLITTRYKRVLPNNDTLKRVEVDQLEAEQALVLISQDLPPDEETEALQELATRLGNWALLVKLANATLQGRVKRGMSLVDVITRVNKILDAGDFTALRNASDEIERNRAFGASLSVSLDTLRDLEGDDAVHYFEQLAIFPEDIPIPLATLEKLWSISEWDTEILCEAFDDLSLLTRYDLTEPASINIHDVVRAHLRKQNEKALNAWHRTFLNQYELNGQWHKLNNDEPYLWDNLIYHLLDSDRQDEALNLLLASPQWMNAKYIATIGHQSYANDLFQVIDTFHDSQDTTTAKYLTLLWTARNILSRNAEAYNDNILKTLVYLGHTTEAFAQVQMRTNLDKRFNGMMVIISSISKAKDAPILEQYIDESLKIAHMIADAESRTNSLYKIADVYVQAGETDQAQTILKLALEATNTIADEWKRANSLCKIADVYVQARETDQAQTILKQALEMVNTIADEWIQAYILRNIASVYVQAGETDQAQIILAQALDVAYIIENERGRAYILRHIAHVYSQQDDLLSAQTILAQALEVAHTIETVERQANSLCEIAKAYIQMGETDQAQTILKQALEVAHTIETVERQANSLCEIAKAYIQMGETDQAQTILKQALEVAHTIADMEQRADILYDITCTYAQQEKFMQALDVAHSIVNKQRLVDSLSYIASVYSEHGVLPSAQTILVQVLDIAHTIIDARKRADSLSYIASVYSQQELFLQAVEAAHTIADMEQRADILYKIASVYIQMGETDQAQTILKQALKVIDTTLSRWIRVKALPHIVNASIQNHGFLSAQIILKQALGVAHTIETAWNRADSLSHIANAYAQAGETDQAQTILKQALEVAHIVETAGSRADILCEIASVYIQMGETDQAQTLLKQALKVAHTIADAERQVESLCYIANAYTQAGKADQAQTILKQALEVTHSTENEMGWGYSLSHIVDAYAQAGEIDQAIEVTHTIADAEQRAYSLYSIARAYNQQGQFTQALEVAHTIETAGSRADILCEIANTYIQAGETDQVQSILKQAVEVVNTIADTRMKTEIMDTITHTYIQQGQFAQAVEVANSIPDKRSRTGSLSYVVKMCIQQGQFAQAIEVAHTIEEERSRTDNLYHIANHLISIDIYQAYIVLGTRYIDEYIQTVSKWLSELYPYDALDIIAEMVRIAGWHDPQWRKIYEILKPNAEST